MLTGAQFFQSLGKDAGNSITGENSKAIIVIEDERPAAGSRVNVTETAARNAGSTLGRISNTVSQAAAAVSQAASQATSAVLSPNLNRMAQNMAAAGGQPNQKLYEVKFNPSQISFRAQGGMKVAKKNFALTEGENQVVQIQYQDMHPRIEMNVQLIFDDCERTDAFGFEKFSDGMAFVRTAVSSGVKGAQGTVYSVKPQVEGFIAAMRNAKTRKITFNWGWMWYTGVINSIDAEYTMFSMAGHPIRAVVNLGILCVDESLGDNNMGQWEQSFRRAFGTSDGTNLESAMQNVGSLLNINL